MGISKIETNQFGVSVKTEEKTLHKESQNQIQERNTDEHSFDNQTHIYSI